MPLSSEQPTPPGRLVEIAACFPKTIPEQIIGSFQAVVDQFPEYAAAIDRAVFSNQLARIINLGYIYPTGKVDIPSEEVRQWAIPLSFAWHTIETVRALRRGVAVHFDYLPLSMLCPGVPLDIKEHLQTIVSVQKDGSFHQVRVNNPFNFKLSDDEEKASVAAIRAALRVLNFSDKESILAEDVVKRLYDVAQGEREARDLERQASKLRERSNRISRVTEGVIGDFYAQHPPVPETAAESPAPDSSPPTQ
jgi:hypothetical protein